MPSRETIAKRMKDIRESPAVNMSQEDIARALDVTTKTYWRWENAESDIPLPKLELFCQTTGSSLGQILSDIPEADMANGVVPMRKIPIVNRIPASGFVLSFDEAPTEEWTYTDNLTEEGIFALRVQGDSMAPRIENGDLVIVSPNREFENNKIYAIVIKGDEHTLKTVRKIDQGYWLLPFNPAFQPMIVHDADIVRFYRVIGMQKVL